MLTILSVDQCTYPDPVIEVDDYIPLSVRTYSGLLGGVLYLRLGGSKTNLLELLLSPESGVVRGITLTTFDKMHTSNIPEEGVTEQGLPIFDLGSDDFKRLESGFGFDQHCPLSVGLRDDFVEIELFGISSYNRAIRHGKMVFLLNGMELVGVRVELSREQAKKFKLHL
ncbi:hypothetical protein FNU76_05735 [Chitinimonas arctica]|uniref:Uncharacterized protein n=1 Tax=Chitinimonas arctica TaxID=2594795 RepID=A0A516SCL8_9NEIS|nr:hypothetical protein [Chitinimonas arctica]QDQ25891.1 hypothetical protein FNU76_05735 [Chitinimonas arctica]